MVKPCVFTVSILHPVFFPFCTGKYRWHGGTEAYTGREVQDIPGVLAVFAERRKDSFWPVCPADERHPELMFRHPENEYDWLSSDAAVDEALLINEYTFTEGGLRAG